jgi:hypothetical protein
LSCETPWNVLFSSFKAGATCTPCMLLLLLRSMLLIC